MEKYINFLKAHKNKPITDILKCGRTLCPELPTQDELDNYFANSKPTNKGLRGQIIEYGMFGNKPNSDKKPDLGEYDVKVTTFKKIWKESMYRLKEPRVSLTFLNLSKPLIPKAADTVKNSK